MAFEKMTKKELYSHLINLCEPVFGKYLNALVDDYVKVGARALKVSMSDGQTLYFMWYDDNNWTLGTKLYRQRPKSRIRASEEPVKNGSTLSSAQLDLAISMANSGMYTNAEIHDRIIGNGFMVSNGKLSVVSEHISAMETPVY